MAGVKGRSGRISNEEQRARRIEAARLGGLAKGLRVRTAEDQIRLSKIQIAEFAQEARKAGVEPPETVADALKFKQLMVAEERRLKLIADRESIEGYRIPINLVDSFLGRIVALMNRNLDSGRSIFEDITEINDAQRKIVRDRLIGWVERIKTDISREQLDESSAPTERHGSDQQGSAEEPVEEA